MTTSQNIDLKRLLNDSKDANGSSLFDHLCTILNHIDSNPGCNSFEDFENLSHFLATNKFAYQKYSSAEEVNNRQETDPTGIKSHLARVETLVREQNLSTDAWVQDFREINTDWNEAGFGFSEEEAFLLGKTLERLSAKHGCDSISFLGILKGSKQDYFVAYGRLKKHVKDQLPENWEQNGEGANEITFWVTNNLLSPTWTELPVVSPDMIQSARAIKHAFTGDLEASVISYPEFKGKEKHFLRVQLARIMHNCEIVPTGMYKPNDDKRSLWSYLSRNYRS